MKGKPEFKAITTPEQLWELGRNNLAAFLSHGGFSVNEMGFREISQKIQTKLDRMDDDTKIHFLEETFDNFFIFRVATRGGNMDGETLYRRGYQTNADGSIEFTGEAQPVVKKVDYVTANNEKGATTMSKDGKGPCCPEKVEALIANTETKWMPDDREVLLTMTAEQLEKLTPVEVKTEKIEVKDPGMNKEQAVQVLQEHLGDPDKFLALLPPETRGSVEHGLQLYKAHRAQVIEHITANTDVYPKERLEAMSMQDLDDLARAIKVPTDFSLLGGGNPAPTTHKKGSLLPPGVQ